MLATDQATELSQAAHRMAVRLSPEPQDAAQYAVLQVLERGARGLDAGKGLGWHIRGAKFYIGHYEARQKFRDERVTFVEEVVSGAEEKDADDYPFRPAFGHEEAGLESKVAAKELARAIMDALKQLPNERQKIMQVYLAYRATGLSQREAIPATAQRLRKSPRNVYNAVVAGTQTLRVLLAEWQ